MKRKMIISVASMMILVYSSFAASHKESTEDRQKMGEMHSKMSECLKSDKPMSDCKSEMMKNCPMMGKDGCPMMGTMKGMKGMKKAGMMKQDSEDSSKDKY